MSLHGLAQRTVEGFPAERLARLVWEVEKVRSVRFGPAVRTRSFFSGKEDLPSVDAAKQVTTDMCRPALSTAIRRAIRTPKHPRRRREGETLLA